ncbi:MAG: ATP-binding protein [Acutalibacter sp.]|nr:ATP-binding protein [Acutalibacter sp.]
MKPAKVILICGLLCSGKSTYAAELSKQEKAPVLSCDALMLAMFDERLGDDHERVSAKAQTYLFDLAVQHAKLGIPVILDWGFWTKQSRGSANRFFAEHNIPVEWHFVEVTDEMWRHNIEKRNAARTPGTYYVDEGLMQKCLSRFEQPEPGEMDIWYQNTMKE